VLEHAHAAHALEVVPLDEAAERFAALAPLAHRLIGNLHPRLEFSAANGHSNAAVAEMDAHQPIPAPLLCEKLEHGHRMIA
jgi:hypothetical protein